MLEKTAEQLAEEKKAQREAARPQPAKPTAPATARTTTAASPPSGQAAAQVPSLASQLGWIFSVMLQALYVVSVFLAGTSPLIWLPTGGVAISNFVQRKPGWLRFIAAVFVSSLLASIVHGMKN